MGIHVKEQRVLILLAHFPTDLKSIISLSSLISKSNCPQFLPSLVCLCFSITFQILAIACNVLETDTTHFFSLQSFLSPWPHRTVLCQWLLSFFPSNSSQESLFPKVGFCLFCCIYFLPSESQDSCKSKWIRTPGIVPWCDFSFPSLLRPFLISGTGTLSGGMISLIFSVPLSKFWECYTAKVGGRWLHVAVPCCPAWWGWLVAQLKEFRP